MSFLTFDEMGAAFPRNDTGAEILLGNVVSVNADGISAQVQLGTGTATRCPLFCECAAGDRVIVAQFAGQCAVIGKVPASVITYDKLLNFPYDYDSQAQSFPSTTWYTRVRLVDKNGLPNGQFGVRVRADGGVGLALNARRQVNGSTIDHMLAMTILNDGTRHVGFTDAAAWLSGLGIADNVASSGSSNGWNWVKMRNGRAACWCAASDVIATWEAWGNQYRGSNANTLAGIAYPFSFTQIDAFLAVPSRSASGASAYAIDVAGNPYGSSNLSKTPGYYYMRPNTYSSATYRASFLVLGVA